MEQVLRMFHPDTAGWFAQQVGEPTAVQCQAWPAIGAGGHVLVSAPTGTGKTLAAFLVLIDRLREEARRGELPEQLQVIYISPLKALGNDIRENLKRPLEGIGGPELRVAVRTGDTPNTQRQAMLRRPPHILITTPESLYLLLTSARGRAMLATARTVILDELHVMMNNKRGAHLMLSLARLDALAGRPLQRIGLSATLRPLSLAAEYLAPGEPVTVVAPPMEKRADMRVESVLEDMRTLPEGSIWPSLCERVYEACRGRRTVIAFLEGRSPAEKLARGVNELAGEDFARTHHGSISKERRLEAEEALRSGKLRLLCATSSMELGIDVGEVDLVLQIGCPMTVSGATQRMGRAGHRPGEVSVMTIFPRTAAEGLPCALTAATAMEGNIEIVKPPRGCLDVLAQHLVSMASESGYTVEGALAVLRRAFGYENLTRESLCGVLEMLAGDYEHDRDKPVRPRIVYDRIHGTVEGDNYSRMLALSAGGTIPDRGMYPVFLSDGTRLGELDEEFVFEARVGDKFLLGAFAWRILEIRHDRVLVAQTTPEGAQAPFWKGDGTGRSWEVSLRFGQLQRSLGDAAHAGQLERALMELRMDRDAARNTARHIQNQLQATGCLPDDKTIVAEHFADEAGENQLMIHAVFGRRVNYALSLLLQRETARAVSTDVRAFEDDDGILLHALGGQPLPEGLLQRIDPERAEATLRAILPSTSLFFMAFRYNAARALLMGVRSGQRQPLWVQRMRGAQTLGAVAGRREHPIMEETMRECLEDYLDMEALTTVLRGIRAGTIRVREVRGEGPSPMALPLRRQAEAVLLYDYSPIPTAAVEASRQSLEALEGVTPESASLQTRMQRRRAPENENQLHALLMTEGDMAAGEADAPIEWLESLASQGRALYIEPGLWIAAEEGERYCDERQWERIARRCLRYRGAQDALSLAERYDWPEEDCAGLLSALTQKGEAVFHETLYYHRDVYAQAQRDTLYNRRRRVVTQPPEHYAAMMARKLYRPGSAQQQLQEAMEELAGSAFPIALWENMLLPARVGGYRPAMLDQLLAQGEYLWQIIPGRQPQLMFIRYAEVDWDGEPEAEGLSEDEETIFQALRQRGASFAHALAPLLGARPVLDVLMSLAQKGLVRADSFVPLRQWAALEDSRNQKAKRTARVRVMAQQAGRWELVRPAREKSDEDRLAHDLAKKGVLCRETVESLPWSRALELLRVWEYTGRVRRGYFVKGLSGAQFVTEENCPAVTAALAEAGDEVVWLNAADPLMVWGKSLPRGENEDFQSIPGTAVCLVGGQVAAILSRQGERLRLPRPEAAPKALTALKRAFAQQSVFPGQSRIVIRDYPEDAGEILKNAGFSREMRDYVLWRGR